MNDLLTTFGANADVKPVAGFELGRVCAQNRTHYQVQTATARLDAQVSGRFANLAMAPVDFPVVGDWVQLRPGTAVIERLLPRHTALVRKAAGRTSAAQVVAANVDTVFLCMAMDKNYNLRRLERYLALAEASQATPVVVLTKADLAADLPAQVVAVTALAGDAQVCVVHTGAIAPLEALLHPATTYAFIGSSGVGKTTLINALLGTDELATQAVRQHDAHGRHTTTGRDLFRLPNGALVIDTPGMRELGMVEAAMDNTFADVMSLAADCKFSDCTHTNDPGCAVQAALLTGALDPARLASYQRLQEEAAVNQALRGKARENAKIDRMFGSRKNMVAMMKAARNKRQ